MYFFIYFIIFVYLFIFIYVNIYIYIYEICIMFIPWFDLFIHSRPFGIFFFFSPLSYSEYCCYKQTCTYICLNNCFQFWGEGCIPKSGIVGSLDYLLLHFEDSASSWGQLVWSLLVLILCLVDFSNLFHPQFHLLSVSPSIHSFKFSLGITF